MKASKENERTLIPHKGFNQIMSEAEEAIEISLTSSSSDKLPSVYIENAESIVYGNVYNNCTTNNHFYNPTKIKTSTLCVDKRNFEDGSELFQPIISETVSRRNDLQEKICGRNNNQNTENNCCYHNQSSISRWWTDATWDLKRKLKDTYKNAILPRVAWMEKGSNLHLKDYYAELQLDSTGEILRIEDIFEENITGFSSDMSGDGESEVSKPFMGLSLWSLWKCKEKLPKRILIEGQPGFGKTTLTSKLAFDWATDAQYMKRFELVFVLHLKEVVGETVTTGIAKESQKCNFNDDGKLQDAICSNGDKVLIILDGFDELPPGNFRENVLKVLYKMNYSDAIVAVTCRNGMFEVGHEELRKFSSAVAKKFEFWDRKVNVIGVDVNGMKKLLTKFLSDTRANEMIRKLQTLDEPFSGIFNCPLILMLLAFLYDKGIIVEFQTTRTKLYKAILDGLAKYNIARQNGIVDENFDLFAVGSNSTFLSDGDLRQFGKICIELLVELKFKFENDDSIERIYKIGFLSKFERKTLFSVSFHYESIHRSFIEFFAAFYVWQEWETAENKLLDRNIIQILHKLFFDSQGTSLVLPFLLGMMQSRVHLFFDQIFSNGQLFSRFQSGLWRMLEECEQSEETIESLVPFIPPLIYSFEEKPLSTFASSDFFERIVRKGIDESKLLFLIVTPNGSDICKCPQNGNFKGIGVLLTSESLDNEVYEKYSKFFNRVSSSGLAFVFIGKFENSKNNQIQMRNWLNLFDNSKAEKKTLFIRDSTTCGLLFSCLKNGALQQKSPIHFMYCNVISDDSEWVEFVLFFVKRNRVKGLQIMIGNSDCLLKTKEILKCCSTSDSLSTLVLRGKTNETADNFVLDLQSLTDGSLKNWDCVDFSGLNLINTNPAMKEFNVNGLTIFKTDDIAAETILNSNVSALECHSQFLFKLRDDVDYVILTSLKELVLHIDEEFVEPKCWKKLPNFKNVEKLAFYIRRENSLPEKLILSLKSMKMNHLEIMCHNSSFNTTERLIQQLTNSFPWEEKESGLIERFNVNVMDEIPNLNQLMIPLMDCVEKKILKEVGIVWNNEKSYKSESLSWINTKNFRMEYCFAGMKTEDIQYWRRWYDIGERFPKVNIQLRF